MILNKEAGGIVSIRSQSTSDKASMFNSRSIPQGLDPKFSHLNTGITNAQKLYVHQNSFPSPQIDHPFNLDKGQSNKFQQMRQQLKDQKTVTPVSKLPRTGIEQPFIRERPRFIETHREFERIAVFNQALVEEYEKFEMENGQQAIPNSKIVYDCQDPSPYYENQQNYINEADFVELPPDEQEISRTQKQPTYAFTSPPQYNPGQVNAIGKRINRYYSCLKPYYVKESDNDPTLVFESRFESGNLRRVVQMGEPNNYNLILKYDYNTTTYTQWFYFKITNTRKDTRYRFNIINLIKPDSSYNQGQKPLIYSMKEASKPGGLGWYRDGENIAYFQNSMKKKGGGNYFTISFEITLKHDDDEVYIANCYPYTYSDCCELLSRLCTNDSKDKIRKTVLTKTIAGNDCEMVIITNFLSKPEDIAVRRAVILTSRVHPGESNASFMMQGTLEYLVSEDEGARYLRDNFVFKIIPMLNPDGVIVGNYRCSLSGLDLNRQWTAPTQRQCPENFATKIMMRKTQDSRDILFYCDYHGHSRAKNLFMYGCSNQKADRLKERIFPLLYVQKSRESTARVVMWREFNLINSFTLETTFCGPTEGRYQDCHFTISILKQCGREFCRTLLDYASNEPKVREAIRELETLFPPQKEGEGLSQHFNDEYSGRQSQDTDETTVKDKSKLKKKEAKIKKEKEPSTTLVSQTRNGHSTAMERGPFDKEEKKKNSQPQTASQSLGVAGSSVSQSGGGVKKRMKSKIKGVTSANQNSIRIPDQDYFNNGGQWQGRLVKFVGRSEKKRRCPQASKLH